MNQLSKIRIAFAVAMLLLVTMLPNQLSAQCWGCGCELHVNVQVQQPINCTATGSVTLTITGVTGDTLTPPFVFGWSGPISGTHTTNSTSYTITGMPVGNYNLWVVSLANGCSWDGVCTFINTGPELYVWTDSDEHCSQGDGIATAWSPTAISYLWSNGETTTTIDSLSAGTYCVTVTDAYGCTSFSCTDVWWIDGPSASGIVTHTTCNQPNGKIILSVWNGSWPYTYLWNDGFTTKDRFNLAAGTYTVTVTDAYACTSEKSFVVNPSNSTSTLSTVSACGFYTWNVNGVTYNASGVYTNIVGCHTDSLVLTVNSSPIINTFVVQPTCTTGGSITLLGDPNFFYDWEDSQLGEQIRTNLQSGIYSVTIEDALTGCSVDISLVLFEPVGSDTTHIVVETCDPEEVGIFTETFTGAGGCDSVVVVNTTLGPDCDDECEVIVSHDGTENDVRVKISADGEPENIKYVLYNAQGRLVKKGNLQVGENQIEVAPLELGIYYLQIRADVKIGGKKRRQLLKNLDRTANAWCIRTI